MCLLAQDLIFLLGLCLKLLEVKYNLRFRSVACSHSVFKAVWTKIIGKLEKY